MIGVTIKDIQLENTELALENMVIANITVNPSHYSLRMKAPFLSKHCLVHLIHF